MRLSELEGLLQLAKENGATPDSEIYIGQGGYIWGAKPRYIGLDGENDIIICDDASEFYQHDIEYIGSESDV